MNARLESLSGLALLDPWFLLLALLVPPALWMRHRRGSPAVHFAPTAFLEPGLPRPWRLRLRSLPVVLQVCALLATTLALARPVRRTALPLATQGIDILLCFDVSSSMSANDMDPHRSRLDVAKAAAAQFIAGRPDDRIGLISFARYPDIVCPLTLDHRALQQFVTAVALVDSDGPEDATGIGTAVARAAQVLQDSAAKSKVVILLTDGEENVATAQNPDEIAPVHAAQLCKEIGARVYAIAAGIGRPDALGNWVALDTSQVRRVASSTGGQFYEARDAGAVTGVYASINDLERTQLEAPRYKVEEGFLPFLLAAVALLLTGRLLQSSALEVLP